jgi:hypothetical protein
MYKKSKVLRIIRKEMEQGAALGTAQVRAGLRSPATLDRWRNRPLIEKYVTACINRKDSVRIKMVEDSLLKAAIDGNTTAIIFFLTNRAPDVWADKRAVFNNTIVNKVGGNGSFTGQDAELQKRIRADLINFMPE